MKFKNLLSNLLTVFIILTFLLPFTVENANAFQGYEFRPTTPNAQKSWTFMLYFCADTRDDYVTQNKNNSANWLNGIMDYVVNKLVTGDLLTGSETDLNIICLYDHPYSQNDPDGRAKIYEIRSYGYATHEDYGPINMGHPATLSNFITYCKTNFPADNYALLISDHGRGYAGFCYDYHAPHPWYDYAIGDCLTVEELELAISNAGGVDVMFFNTCLGSSFEVAWQLRGEVDYMVASESVEPPICLYHPRDILYELSRDTTMTPLELAYVGYDSAVAPTLIAGSVPTITWDSVQLFDLTQFDVAPVGGGLSLADAFEMFAFYLFEEMTYNLTHAREIFTDIRNDMYLPWDAVPPSSLMVDAADMVRVVLKHTNELQYGAEILSYGAQLKERLKPDLGNVLLANYSSESYTDDLYGFTLCFPNTQDLWQGFLYPNFYHHLDMCVDTHWDEFIFGIFPPLNQMVEVNFPDYYEIYMAPIDPTVQLHVFIDLDPYVQPLHIGYVAPEEANVGMNIEIGVQGASFIDTMLTGNCLIQIPVSSIPAVSKDTIQNIQVVVDASKAASTAKDVNLTVRHVGDEGIIWEDTKISEIAIGQIIATDVSTDDEWSDWEELAPPVSTPKFDGFEIPTTIISICFTFVILIIPIKQKQK